MPESYFSITAN